MKDYYEILGVSENASNEQIKKQYRLLLHAWHPDKFPTAEFKSEAEEKIKDLNEAYDVLSNSVKRAAYNKQRILYKEVTVTSVQGDDGFSNKKEERNVSTHEKSTINFKRKKKTVAIPRVVISVITVFVLVFLLFVFQTNNFLPKAVPVTNTTRAPLPTSTKKVFSTPIIITPTLPVSDFIDEFGIPMNLISEGEFVMGSDNGEKQELPVHKVYVKSYYIDLYEVTNALYRKCYYEGACGRPRENNGGYDNVYLFNQQYNNYPVVFVDWNMANSFCQWRGGRLPTEAEWEKAARGVNANLYPWGNETINCSYANYNGENGCLNELAQVGMYASGVSPYGIYDMTGNVWEWVSSIAKPYPYNASDGREAMNSSSDRVIRGGAWNSPGNIGTATFRSFANINWTSNNLGFRCVRDIKE